MDFRGACGGTMKIIAVIEPACADTADRRPAIVRQIRSAELATKPRPLGLPTGAASFRAPPDPPDGRAADQPPDCVYGPFLDDLAARDPMLG
jgi:hypothetical protein